MRLTYTENPLATKVELEENEKAMLYEKCRYNHLDEYVTRLHYKAHYGDGVKKEDLSFDEWLGDKADAAIQQHYDVLLEELATGVHVGDCTSCPCSCLKCYTEDMLSICTLPAGGKTMNYYIQQAFRIHDTIDAAITWLDYKDEEQASRYVGKTSPYQLAIKALTAHKEKLS